MVIKADKRLAYDRFIEVTELCQVAKITGIVVAV